jgi:hypothetical protein
VGVEMHNPVAFFINVRLLNFWSGCASFFWSIACHYQDSQIYYSTSIRV